MPDARSQRPAGRHAGARPRTISSCLASESGVLPFAEQRHHPQMALAARSSMLLIDLEAGPDRRGCRIESRAGQCSAALRGSGSRQAQYKLEDLDHIEPELSEPSREHKTTLLQRQQAFGYTQEDIARFLEPMARKKATIRSGRWARTPRYRRVVRTGAGCSTTISSRTSLRSPTRRSTRSARSW